MERNLLALVLAFCMSSAVAAPAVLFDEKLREIERAGRQADPAGNVTDYPALFALVEPDKAGYRFTRFSFQPVSGPGWVQLFDDRPMWEVKYQNCRRHLFGGDCEKPAKNSFAKVNAHPVANLFMTGLTFGVSPLFFGIETTYSFDARQWQAALAEAKARHEKETGQPLQADLDRLRANGDILLTLEQRGREVLRERQLDMTVSGNTPALLAAGHEGLAGAEFRYPWREGESLQSASLSDLVAHSDTVVQRYARSAPRDWPLQLRCPAPRLRAYVLADVCNPKASWQGEILRISGDVHVKGFALPRQYPTEITLSEPSLEANYRHGVLWMRNKSDRPVLVEKVALLLGGREVPRWLARKELKPGEEAFFAGFTLDLPEMGPPAEGGLLDSIRLGTLARYGLRIHALDAQTYEPKVFEMETESTMEELLATILRSESTHPEPLDYEALKRVGRLTVR